MTKINDYYTSNGKLKGSYQVITHMIDHLEFIIGIVYYGGEINTERYLFLFLHGNTQFYLHGFMYVKNLTSFSICKIFMKA